MTDLNHFAKNRVFHGFSVGFPGTMKTGSIAVLINNGMKARFIDFDRNIDPLIEYVKPEFRQNVEVAQFWNPLELKSFSAKVGTETRNYQKLVPVGTPTAYSRALRLITDGWRYADPSTNQEVNLGKIRDWGADTVVVLDSLTSQGERIRDATEWLLGRQSKGLRIQDWGLMQHEQTAFLEALRAEARNCHLIVIAHLKLIEPKFLDDLTNDATEDETKEKLREIMQRTTEMIPPKFFPSAIGRQLPQEIGKALPYILRYETKKIGAISKRVMNIAPSEECDVKAPLAKAVLKELVDLDPEVGLLKIFNAIRAAS